MGRNLSFYAVNNKSEHEKDKPICLGWEYERDYEEVQNELYEHFNKDKAFEDYKTHEHNKKVCYDEKQPYSLDKKDYKYILNPDWCLRCAMFANEGLYNSPLVIDSVSFSHSYRNPIWSSDWYFYCMYPGSRHTDFCNRFDTKHMYYEIHENDIASMKYSLEKCGKAYRTCDREAMDETLSAISFCEKWISDPNVVVIYSSEV